MVELPPGSFDVIWYDIYTSNAQGVKKMRDSKYWKYPFIGSIVA